MILDPVLKPSDGSDCLLPEGQGGRHGSCSTGVREGREAVEADDLWWFIDYQSRSLRDFILFARGS